MPNEKQQYPLHFAAYHEHVKCVELLLEEGADTEVVDTRGRTPAEDIPGLSDSSCYAATGVGYKTLSGTTESGKLVADTRGLSEDGKYIREIILRVRRGLKIREEEKLFDPNKIAFGVTAAQEEFHDEVVQKIEEDEAKDAAKETWDKMPSEQTY